MQELDSWINETVILPLKYSGIGDDPDNARRSCPRQGFQSHPHQSAGELPQRSGQVGQKGATPMTIQKKFELAYTGLIGLEVAFIIDLVKAVVRP